MNEIREAAKAYHANLSQDEKTEATKCFKSMDSDGDGKINLREFMGVVVSKEKSRFDYDVEGFFKELDKDEDGNLEFEDFLIFIYLSKYRTAFVCDGCKAFIKGVYFTCIECFFYADRSFDLCCSCYRNSFYLHRHDDYTSFVDNYALLLTIRKACKELDNDRSLLRGKITNALRFAMAAELFLTEFTLLVLNASTPASPPKAVTSAALATAKTTSTTVMIIMPPSSITMHCLYPRGSRRSHRLPHPLAKIKWRLYPILLKFSTSYRVVVLALAAAANSHRWKS
ncbi:Calcium-binding EF-hand [Corchorus capsularis]|uniref:Calcium-binding EF-hand n=1 Tax=Corchorus capsularis TaxID=210143 RepID=A0A1R3JK65_COCAP|nr:Calcium-binding EF-hand [Corchorus capsularis]